MDANSNWRRDILLIPLAVGILVAAVAYFLPKLFDNGKRISYTVDGPSAYVNRNVTGAAVKIIVGGVETPNIYGYKVRIWNSGGIPLTSLPIRFSFNTTNTNFTIFNVTHKTSPESEFGKIEENNTNQFSKRFVYELLNPKDEDVLTFLTSSDPTLSVFAKAEGLTFFLVEAKDQSAYYNIPMQKWMFWMLAVLGIVSSGLSLITRWISERKEEREYKSLRTAAEEPIQITSKDLKNDS
jgi:hypothetical protein